MSQTTREYEFQTVDLARSLGIPASPPRTEADVRGLFEAIRERVHANRARVSS